MPKYFDVHSHLNSTEYAKDIDEVVNRLKETETHTIVVGTDFESSKRAVELADKYNEIYACIGIHPIDSFTQNSDISLFSELSKHPKVVAIGECGFDFFHADKSQDYERQKILFLNQLEFAVACDKPVMIHARNAYEELIDTLESYSGKLRGNIHFFAGSKEVAERIFILGFSISFTGVITFTHDYDDVIKAAPLDRIMSETDSPFVAPIPYRGRRNEPSYVSEVVKAIARIRQEEEELVRTSLAQNAISMIG